MVVVEANLNELKKMAGVNDEELTDTLFLLKCENVINDDVIEIEVNPDRPDMYSVEGVSRAIKGFLGKEIGMVKYAVMKDREFVKVDPVESRPFIACAIIKDVIVDDAMIKSLMQIQEKLHATIGRNRKKVAIGIHDYDKVNGPFVYKDVSPREIEFVPLDESKEMNLDHILKVHPKGKDYANLLAGYAKYPIILDSRGNVLSFPPIINGNLTRVTEKTKNFFIDVTGTDKNAVDACLNIITCNIAERCGTIEKVRVAENTTPNLDPYIATIRTPMINRILGFDLKEKQIHALLERMRYSVLDVKGDEFKVLIPAYRYDVIHPIDLVEDVAIAYGYNNIEPEMPKISTIGGLGKKELFTRKARDLMVGLGFQEYFGFVLTNRNNQFNRMNVFEEPTVEILNPVTTELDICRRYLLPGLMKFLSVNKHEAYPQAIFEVGDCIEINKKNTETGTVTVRRLAGVISKDNANLTELKSIVEALLSNLGYKYEIRPCEHTSFIDSRVGEIHINGKFTGYMGEISPEVLVNWQLDHAVIAFEIELTQPAE